MACQEACNESVKSEIEIDMRRKYSKRKHLRRNRQECNARGSGYTLLHPFGDSSQYNWFWENYYNALEWQERHQVAYWRSRSIALEYENNLLHQYVQSLNCSDGSPRYCTVEKHNSKTSASRNVHSPKTKKWNAYQQQRGKPSRNKQHQKEDPNEDKFEFQVTEEMMDFFEQSIRHKMELKKQREGERNMAEKQEGSDDAALPPRKQVGLQRTQEMKLMYGKAAPMILGMETAMQLSFDRNCDLRHPKLWPHIPLRL